MTRSTDTRVNDEAHSVRDISLTALAGDILQYRRIVIGITTTMFVLGVLFALFRPKRYEANLSFVMQSGGGSGSALAGVAAQFGFSIPGQDRSESPDVYATILQSSTLTREIVNSRFTYTKDGRTTSGTLIDFYGIKDGSARLRTETAVDILSRSTSIGVAVKTGIVGVSVFAEDSLVAYQIASRYFDVLKNFVLHNRQSRARAEREFTEQRLKESREELSAAESRLESFMSQNRGGHSPQLDVQQSRLTRDIAMRQDLFTSLAQAYDHAKIEEVRDVPALTLIDSPSIPAKAKSRGIAQYGLLGLIVGLVVGIFVAFSMSRFPKVPFRS